MALARAVGSGNSVAMMARMTDEAAAAPTPWMKRATINVAAVGASPQAADAAVNVASPIKKMRRRPMRSPRRPNRRRSPPKAMRYEVVTQVRTAPWRSRSLWIWGIATFTTVASSTSMNWATSTERTTSRRRRASAGVLFVKWPVTIIMLNVIIMLGKTVPRVMMKVAVSRGSSIPHLTRLIRRVYRRATPDLLGMNLKQLAILASLRERGALPQQ